jgi:hypothetical protein
MFLPSKKVLMAFVFLVFSTMLGSSSAWSGDWTMVFTISVPDSNADGGLLVNRLEAGGLSTATDLFDNNSDVMALLAGPVQAAFTHEGETSYPRNLQLLWRDIRADGLPKSWRIKVVSQQSGFPVTVAWTAPPSIASDTCHLGSVSFKDQTTGQSIDLNSTPGYTFSSNGTVGSPEVRFFTLTVTSIPQNAPSVPTGLVSSGGISQLPRFHFVRLAWKADNPTNLAGYNIWRSRSSGSGYVRLNAVPFLNNWYLDKQVKTGTTYYYVVTAMGTNGCESGYSKQTTATAGQPTLR